jgi:hypothetical protein
LLAPSSRRKIGVQQTPFAALRNHRLTFNQRVLGSSPSALTRLDVSCPET